MSGRPPLSYRWELHLGVGMLGLLLAGVTRRADSAQEPPDAFTPGVRGWWEARRAERESWLGTFSFERQIIRAVTSLVLAWRSFRLERQARR